MRRKLFSSKPICMMFVVATGIAYPQQRILVIDGHTGQAPVIEANGKSCVEIEALASLTNGSLSFSGNQITLTLHGSRQARPEGRDSQKTF